MIGERDLDLLQTRIGDCNFILLLINNDERGLILLPIEDTDCDLNLFLIGERVFNLLLIG